MISEDYDSRPIHWVLQSLQHFYYYDIKEGGKQQEIPKEQEEQKKRPLLTFDRKGEKRRRIHLTHFVKDHGIWEEAYRWESWIQSVLEDKLAEHDFFTKQRLKRREPEPESKRAKTLLGGMASGLRRMLGRGELERLNLRLEDDQQYEAGRRNIVYNAISSFIYFMSILQRQLTFSKPIILHLVESYDLKLDKAHMLLM